MATLTGNKLTYYEILGLPEAASIRQNLSGQQVKVAYRKALLKYHPDKYRAELDSSSPVAEVVATDKKFPYTVDQISKAYAVLSMPKLRSEYNLYLKLQSCATNTAGQQQDQIFRTGLETVDLEDLAYDDAEKIWHKSCRCGDIGGFLVEEADLEEFSDEGELHVGCRGCSLWLRVLFEVVVEHPTKRVPEGRMSDS